jgi:hypothetical protein
MSIMIFNVEKSINYQYSDQLFFRTKAPYSLQDNSFQALDAPWPSWNRKHWPLGDRFGIKGLAVR